nr:hypothetical protein GCM10020092_055720 [Actinoplanes digitatis]
MLLSGGSSDPAMVAHHARGASRYDDMVAAARRGTELYLSIGSAYQALQLAEMGLDEAPEDAGLLAAAARAAWLAGLLDDARRHARRWRDLAAGTTDRAESLYLLVRLAWESRDTDEMGALTRDIETLIARLPPGADQARAITAIAQSAYLRDDLDAALLWSDRALALADEFDLPAVRRAALMEKGATLTERPQTAAASREILSALVDEAEKAGEWVLAARALKDLVQGEPPTSSAEHAETLERMRVDAERAGFESLAVASYFQGRARLALRAGDLGAAIAALEEGREQDRGYRRVGRWADYHGVFLAGLYLEAGELDRVEGLIADLTALPDNPPSHDPRPRVPSRLPPRRPPARRADPRRTRRGPGRGGLAQRRTGARPGLRRAGARPAGGPARPAGRHAARRRRVGRVPDACRRPARGGARPARRGPRGLPVRRRGAHPRSGEPRHRARRRRPLPARSATGARRPPRRWRPPRTCWPSGAAGGWPSSPGSAPGWAWPRSTRLRRSPGRPR